MRETITKNLNRWLNQEILFARHRRDSIDLFR